MAAAVQPASGLFIARATGTAAPSQTNSTGNGGPLASNAFPTKFAVPEFSQQRQVSAAPLGLKERPVPPAHVPAAATHPQWRRRPDSARTEVGVGGASEWPLLPQKWPQHMKTHRGQMRDPLQPGVPLGVAMKRRELASEAVDIQRTLWFKGIDFAELGSSGEPTHAAAATNSDRSGVLLDGGFIFTGKGAGAAGAGSSRLAAGLTVDLFDDCMLEHRTAAEWIQLATPRPPTEWLGRAAPTDPAVVASTEQTRLARVAQCREEEKQVLSEQQQQQQLDELKAARQSLAVGMGAAKHLKKFARNKIFTNVIETRAKRKSTGTAAGDAAHVDAAAQAAETERGAANQPEPGDRPLGESLDGSLVTSFKASFDHLPDQTTDHMVDQANGRTAPSRPSSANSGSRPTSANGTAPRHVKP